LSYSIGFTEDRNASRLLEGPPGNVDDVIGVNVVIGVVVVVVDVDAASLSTV
jgi:hypothetical protein